MSIVTNNMTAAEITADLTTLQTRMQFNTSGFYIEGAIAFITAFTPANLAQFTLDVISTTQLVVTQTSTGIVWTINGSGFNIASNPFTTGTRTSEAFQFPADNVTLSSTPHLETGNFISTFTDTDLAGANLQVVVNNFVATRSTLTDAGIVGLVQGAFSADGNGTSTSFSLTNGTKAISISGFSVVNNTVGPLGVVGPLFFSAALAGNDTITVTGTAGIDLFGFAGNDTMIGGAGNDTLNGGIGNDDLRGGAGNDTYIIDSFSDVLFEGVNQGIDTLVIDANNSFVVSAGLVIDLQTLVNVENFDISRTNLQLLNIGGNNANNVLTGNDANNEIYGFLGADSLIGGMGNDYLDGGAGIDTMNGGLGYDIYIVDNVADAITEAVIDGLNEVRATISYSIANNLAFDNLVLIGSAAINATGNSLNNLLLGNTGNNILDGGAGADAMEGGKGNDTYLWRDAGDTFFELANEGIDTLQLASDFGFAVGASTIVSLGSNIENLDASKIGGVAFDLEGNALNNVLTGNDANNDLVGQDGNDTMFGGAGNDGFLGGQGIDSLVGGIGDDIYAVNLKTTGNGTLAVASLEDIIVESSSSAGGIDSLRLDGGTINLAKASTIVLATGLEHLYAENTIDTKLNLIGNAAANNIIGNNAANIILGLAGDDSLRGGAGDDTLDGGAGNDVYLGGSGNDTYLSELVLLGGLTHVNDTYAADESGIDTIKFSGQVNSATVLEVSLANLSGYENTDISNTGTTKINLVGNDENNALTGNAAANSITGGLGNDTLLGGAGNDSLIGGAGNDSLIGGLGSDNMNGGDGNDIYLVNSVLDITTESTLDSAIGGIDEVRSNVSHTLKDNIENLTLLTVSFDPLTLALNNINGTGNSLNNTLIGNGGNNILNGLAGDDTLNGGLGADTLIGGTGNDTYTIDNALDKVIELAGVGTGTDTINSSVSYSLVDTDIALGIAGSFVENLTLTGALAINGVGNALNNTLTGNNAANILNGLVGDDSINGGAGNDVLVGGIGIDTLDGGEGSDIYFVSNLTDKTQAEITDTGLLGIDELRFSAIVAGTLTVHAGDTGVERVVIGTGTAAIAVNTGLVALNVDASAASNALTMIGNAGANSLIGGASNDTLLGGAGNDSLIGGAGNDSLIGGLGNDSMNGGDGNDIYLVNSVLDITTESTLDSAIGGIDEVRSNVSHTLKDNIENLSLLTVSIDPLTLALNNINGTGNSLNNTLIGNGGNNILSGLDGDDALNGGAGNDVLIGGVGADILTGGLGADRFDFNSITELAGLNIDTIADFSHVQLDKIDLSTIDAKAGTPANDAFTFIGNNIAFSSLAGQLMFDTATHSIYGDVNGDSVADFQIILTGVTSLVAADFVL